MTRDLMHQESSFKRFLLFLMFLDHFVNFFYVDIFDNRDIYIWTPFSKHSYKVVQVRNVTSLSYELVCRAFACSSNSIRCPFPMSRLMEIPHFESRFEDILTMVIPPWIINPYGDIEETNVIIQEEPTELSTSEELKVQFKNGYQQFWLQNYIPVTYPSDRIYKPVSMYKACWHIGSRLLIEPLNSTKYGQCYSVIKSVSPVPHFHLKTQDEEDTSKHLRQHLEDAVDG
ncbi:unnamed protein product [Acanthoscelides obtectus]|uniref:Uncharacterized protein n=1 Tax=Acanthoscelides obtectus TaxID=200917 RepID=A0A9P0LX98_ACAOB|nr:unnamed protein product [Acanthoscelides obtectus]CAK1624677.1 hypothetical protein AOBTE_LOCUS2690 [Acanthoscelides obtectus]